MILSGDDLLLQDLYIRVEMEDEGMKKNGSGKGGGQVVVLFDAKLGIGFLLGHITFDITYTSWVTMYIVQLNPDLSHDSLLSNV